MTVLFNCISQFPEELWKAGGNPMISIEEMSVRSICRRQATTPVAAFTTPMESLSIFMTASLVPTGTVHSQVPTGKVSL